MHGKENPNQLPLSVSFPGATPARRVGSFRGYPFVMIFLAGVIAIPPGATHYSRNGFAGSARSLGDAQTIEIGTLALDSDVGFAFAKSGQSRVRFRDWIVGSVLAKQIWNASSVTAQEPPGYSRPKPSICFGFVLRSVGEPGAPLMKPIRPAGAWGQTESQVKLETRSDPTGSVYRRMFSQGNAVFPKPKR